MHLLETQTLQLHSFFGHVPPYAILSHTWGPEEVTYMDMVEGREFHKQMRGYDKIMHACRLAQGAGYEYLWVDTCCIDKRSSAELSEAINSMYAYYQDASICFAYLDDVDPVGASIGNITLSGDTPMLRNSEFGALFKRARWFTRGWTLQELIAPQHVEFYSGSWQLLGSKSSLRDIISDVTFIDPTVLASGLIQSCSIAERFSWASYRQTTREEDIAYCLLGIFGVNMPLLYGEGQAAFGRLQQAIIGQQEDPSILLWERPSRPGPINVSTVADTGSALAQGPSSFASRLKLVHNSGFSHGIHPLSNFSRITLSTGQEFIRSLPNIFPRGISHLSSDPPAMTTRGLLISLNVLQLNTQIASVSDLLFAWTFYMVDDQFVCLALKAEQVATDVIYLRVGELQLVSKSNVETAVLRRIFLGLKELESQVESLSTWNREEPTLVLQGIEPSSEFMHWWDKIYIENKSGKKDRARAQFSLTSALSLEQYNQVTPTPKPDTAEIELSRRNDIHIVELFLVVHRAPQTPARLNNSTSFVVAIGYYGYQLWCSIQHPKQDYTLLDVWKDLQKQLRESKLLATLSDSCSESLPEGTTATVKIRPGTAIGQVSTKDKARPYLVFISIDDLS